MDWASFILSLVALIILAATALVGLVITWLNHRKAFDPILIMNKKADESDELDYIIKNIGRGTAYQIQLEYYSDNQNEYFVSELVDFLEPNEEKSISSLTTMNFVKSDSDDFFSLGIKEFTHKQLVDDFNAKSDDPRIIEVSFNNEDKRMKFEYFLTWEFISYRTISRRRFNKMLKGRKKGRVFWDYV